MKRVIGVIAAEGGSMILSEIKDTEPRRAHGDISGLKMSIADIGLVNPLTVNEHGEMLSGRRRFQAIKELGWQEVDVRVIPVNGDELKALRVRIHENLHRKPLSEPENRISIAEYDELKRELEGKKDTRLKGRDTFGGYTVASEAGWTQAKTAEDLGISRQSVSEAVKAEEYVKVHPELAGKKTKQISRKAKLERLAEEIKKLKMPVGVYDVIVIDPPWPIAGEYDPDGRCIAEPYPAMSIEQIFNIKIPCADDCILWLWVTNLNMHDGLHLLEKWGFDFKNILTWAKDRFGIGAWLRGQTEHCLLATKGKPVFQGENISTLLNAPRKEHSAKPDAFYELVDRCCIGRKIDYFGCKPKQGWDVFGV